MKTTIAAVILLMFAWAKLEPASCMEQLRADYVNFPAVTAVKALAGPGADLAPANPAASLPSRAIFGKDDRQELFSVPDKWREVGRSIAGKVSADHITDHGASWELHGEP